jgi:hypothetical protein
MTNSTDIVVLIQPYLEDCPPWDEEINPSLLPKIAQEIAKRFDYALIFDKIDELACQALRELDQ